ncbi:hypothetical protein ES705_29225 [subsurface metagenome]
MANIRLILALTGISKVITNTLYPSSLQKPQAKSAQQEDFPLLGYPPITIRSPLSNPPVILFRPSKFFGNLKSVPFPASSKVAKIISSFVSFETSEGGLVLLMISPNFSAVILPNLNSSVTFNIARL